MLAVVLAATLTLLPATLGRLGGRVNAAALPGARATVSGDGSSPRFTSWSTRLWKHSVRYGLAALIVLVALAAPVAGLRTATPSITPR
jgi:RND superfamily putative drug exporter